MAGMAILFVFAGCDRAAEMIPGHGTAPTAKPAPGTPAPIAAPPLLAPGSLRLAGSAGDGGNRPAIPDGELGKTLVQVQALGDSNASVRTGAGVVIDLQQQLILTSYQLVQPFLADGTRGYTRLAVGPGIGGGGAPEFAAELVAANPSFDFAVLRLTGLREGAQHPPLMFAGATLADVSSLRRGDRLRMLAQPAQDRSQPIHVVNGSVTGFSGDGAGESRAWIKTDARLPGIAVGAPVFDQSGALVGIATQLAFDPAAPVAVVRPLARALDVINQARGGGASLRFSPALQHLPSISGAGSAASTRDGAVVSKPVFAENAIEGPGFRDLFDYTNIFRSETAGIDYEFIVQGVAQGSLVQERWYLNGTLQDALSSSYTWSLGNFAVVSDRLTTPNARGIPTGTWTLEVWVAGVVHATARIYVGVAPPDVLRRPIVDGLQFAATASPEQLPGERPSARAGQLLAFFNYRQAAGVQTIRWVAMRNGQAIFKSPPQTWYGGERGTWWVGVTGGDGGVGPGTWEFQIYFDNIAIGTAGVDVR